MGKLPKRRLLAVFTAVSLFMPIVACQKRNYNSQIKILNGQPFTDLSQPGARSTVGIASEANGIPWCTGVLLTNELVVTAAHCFENHTTEGDIAKLFIIFNDIDGTVTSRPVIAGKLFRKPMASFPNFDIAWVKFSGGLPSGSFQPAKVLPYEMRAAAFQPGAPLSLAGYGKTSSRAALDGIRRYVETTFDRYEESTFIRYILFSGPTPQKGACKGDSGGPAYLKVGSEWFLAGIINGTDSRLNGIREPTCENGRGLVTFVPRYLSWISKTANVNLSHLRPAPEPYVFSARLSSTGHTRDWCQAENHTETTFDTLYTLLKIWRSTDCQKMMSELAAQQYLNYMGKVFSFAVVEGLPLTSLSLEGVEKVEDAEKLPQHKTLHTFNLKRTELKTFEFLSLLRSVRTLKLGGSFAGMTVNLNPIAGLSNLEVLDLSANALTSVPSLGALIKLNKLNIQGNSLNHFGFLEGLKNLREVTIDALPVGADTSVLTRLSNEGALRIVYMEERDLSQGRCPVQTPAKCLPLKYF